MITDHEVAILLVSDFSFRWISSVAFWGTGLSLARCIARQFGTEYQSFSYLTTCACPSSHNAIGVCKHRSTCLQQLKARLVASGRSFLTSRQLSLTGLLPKSRRHARLFLQLISSFILIFLYSDLKHTLSQSIARSRNRSLPPSHSLENFHSAKTTTIPTASKHAVPYDSLCSQLRWRGRL